MTENSRDLNKVCFNIIANILTDSEYEEVNLDCAGKATT